MLTLTHFKNTDQAQSTWINIVNPTPDEKQELLTQSGMPEDFLTYGLDPDEGGRYEYDEDSHTGMVIFDAPVAQNDPDLPTYTTTPQTMMITGNGFVTTIEDETILDKTLRCWPSRQLPTLFCCRFSMTCRATICRHCAHSIKNASSWRGACKKISATATYTR